MQLQLKRMTEKLIWLDSVFFCVLGVSVVPSHEKIKLKSSILSKKKKKIDKAILEKLYAHDFVFT